MTQVEQTSDVRREIRIAASPATVFALLTDAKRMRVWLADTVAASPEPGGIFRMVDPGGRTIEGRYVEVVPDRKVVFTWGGVYGLKPGETTVEIQLVPDGAGTLLKLRHSGLPAAVIEAHDAGWGLGLSKLQVAAEGGDPGRPAFGDPAMARQ